MEAVKEDEKKKWSNVRKWRSESERWRRCEPRENGPSGRLKSQEIFGRQGGH